jgi:hypothetical protein
MKNGTSARVQLKQCAASLAYVAAMQITAGSACAEQVACAVER